MWAPAPYLISDNSEALHRACQIHSVPSTVLEIRVNPKKNAPKVSKAPKFEFWNFLLILKIFLKLNDVQLRKLSICKNLLNNESDF